MERVIMVLCNVPDEAVAQRIAAHVVDGRLAACVNLLPAIKSVYRWEGKVESAQEIPLLIKTVERRFDELSAAIRSLHPYDVPEILAFAPVDGYQPYLDWVVKETEKGTTI